VINYYVKDAADSVKASVAVMDKNKKLIRTFSTDAKEANAKMDVNKGMNSLYGTCNILNQNV
jgi:hypothetical protein